MAEPGTRTRREEHPRRSPRQDEAQPDEQQHGIALQHLGQTNDVVAYDRQIEGNRDHPTHEIAAPTGAHQHQQKAAAEAKGRQERSTVSPEPARRPLEHRDRDDDAQRQCGQPQPLEPDDVRWRQVVELEPSCQEQKTSPRSSGNQQSLIGLLLDLGREAGIGEAKRWPTARRRFVLDHLRNARRHIV